MTAEQRKQKILELLKEKDIEISKSGASRIFNKFHDLAISLRLK